MSIISRSTAAEIKVIYTSPYDSGYQEYLVIMRLDIFCMESKILVLVLNCLFYLLVVEQQVLIPGQGTIPATEVLTLSAGHKQG